MAMDMDAAGGALEGGASAGCGACRYVRRRCSDECVLAPYFPASDRQRYAFVHRCFGAFNVARMLQELPLQKRRQAADAMVVEARLRAQDPVYGCAGVISRLQEEIRAAQCELARTRAQITIHHHLHLQLVEQQIKYPEKTYTQLDSSGFYYY